eukprot:7217434-Prymnesium_polylepis.1
MFDADGDGVLTREEATLLEQHLFRKSAEPDRLQKLTTLVESALASQGGGVEALATSSDKLRVAVGNLTERQVCEGMSARCTHALQQNSWSARSSRAS